MQVLAYLDASITHAIAALLPYNPLARSVFLFISRAGGSFFVWLPVLLLVMLLNRKRDYYFVFLFSLSTLFTSATVNYVLKHIFMRERPFMQWGFSALCPADYSFPSGHAAFSFSAAAMLAAYDSRHRLWYYGAAALISYSRIFLYCHFFSDVVAGAFIGYAISRVCLIYNDRTVNNQGSKSVKSRKKRKK